MRKLMLRCSGAKLIHLRAVEFHIRSGASNTLMRGIQIKLLVERIVTNRLKMFVDSLRNCPREMRNLKRMLC